MKRIGFLFLLFSLFLITSVYSKTLELKSWQIWDFSYNGIHQVSCSLAVSDGGSPVAGLPVEEFCIRETVFEQE